ncbi:MAG: hypothetical protein KF832_22380 [Caldilineaceae bacterium]|nr:hypothetical protein [Caldilineaceae bacterium]
MTLLDKQMDLVTKESLLELLSEEQGPCISIYLPTERKSIETQQSPIRLKNLLNEVAATLAARGERTNDIQELVAPAHDLVNNRRFWQYQSDGLALFLSSDRLVTYRVPFPFPEMAMVNGRFYLRPLLPLVDGDGTFYLLALRQGGVRLLQGSRFQLTEVELDDETPNSLAEALRYDEFESNVRFHIGSRPSTGSTRAAPDRGNPIYHGQGGAGDDANLKEQVTRFFRQLDNGVRDRLEDSTQPPLLLAGIDSLRGLYRQINQYQGLVDEDVTIDPETLELPALHQRAWEQIGPRFDAKRQEALDAYHHLAGNQDPRAAAALPEIVAAAYFQRVDTLFLAQSGTKWGTFDPATNQVEQHDVPQPGDEELLDFAAVHTVLNGGSVYIGPVETLPAGKQVAAILRY